MAGLRERKKAKTHEAIQEAALRLFRKQGYEQTTIEQIAEVAEVSPSTFFRYFPTKEDIVLHDALDPRFFAVFAEQPPELSPIQALRVSMRAVLEQLTPQQIEVERERQELIMAVPALRARMLDGFATTMRGMTGELAERVGRSPDDLAVRVVTGALMGAIIAVWITSPGMDRPWTEEITGYLDQFDAALAYLEESGLRI